MNIMKGYCGGVTSSRLKICCHHILCLLVDTSFRSKSRSKAKSELGLHRWFSHYNLMHLTKVSLLSVPLYSLLFTSGWGGIRTHGSVSRHRRFQVYAVMTTSAPNQRGFLPSAKYIATE